MFEKYLTRFNSFERQIKIEKLDVLCFLTINIIVFCAAPMFAEDLCETGKITIHETSDEKLLTFEGIEGMRFATSLQCNLVTRCEYVVESAFNGEEFLNIKAENICNDFVFERFNRENPYYDENGENLGSQYELRSQNLYTLSYQKDGQDRLFKTWVFEYHNHNHEPLSYKADPDWTGQAWRNTIREYGLIDGPVE